MQCILVNFVDRDFPKYACPYLLEVEPGERDRTAQEAERRKQITRT